MSADDKKIEELKQLLKNNHDFPTKYMFKFIVPQTKEAEVKNIFPYENVRMNFSKRGKYVSITVELLMESPEAVLQVYETANKIDGLIAL
jgi:putative lipoic acid-binding regulatory protein